MVEYLFLNQVINCCLKIPHRAVTQCKNLAAILASYVLASSGIYSLKTNLGVQLYQVRISWQYYYKIYIKPLHLRNKSVLFNLSKPAVILSKLGGGGNKD